MGRTILVCALLVATGCNNAPPCTRVGCGASDFLLVRDWMPGEYEVEVSYAANGDVAFVCTLSLASIGGDDDAGDSGNAEGSCTQTRGEPRAIALNLLQGGTAVTLSLYDEPASFELALSRDGQQLFAGEVEPHYETSYPNGPECGTCRMAMMNVDVEE